MPLWLDLLRTPMAAPETRALRRMRFIWQGLCILLALSAGLFSALHGALGPAAPCLVAILLVTTALYGALYLLRKHHADQAYLHQMGGSEA